MSRRSQAVKEWRDRTKIRMVEAMGGACAICGYNECNDSLCLHHLDPTQKEFSFGGVTKNPKAWGKIIVELRKCVLLCHNCHSEIHAGVTELPTDCPEFNEDYTEYRIVVKANCPVCGNEMPKQNKTCSLTCSGRQRRRVDWDNIDLESFLNQGLSYTDIGDLFDVTGAAVSKRARKLGFKKPEPTLPRPTRDELRDLIETKSFCAIGRQFGVSDNAVREWALVYNLLPVQ